MVDKCREPIYMWFMLFIITTTGFLMLLDDYVHVLCVLLSLQTQTKKITD